jgi:hypothetical protein
VSQAAEILTELQRRGVIVAIEGDTLCLKPRRALDNTLLARVRDEKLAILEVLRSGPATCPAKAEIPESVYQERAQRTLREMCLDYEEGTILWLESNAPLLYEAVTCHLPNKISELWSAHAPLEEFDAVLAELLEAHRQAVALCRAARKVIHE